MKLKANKFRNMKVFVKTLKRGGQFKFNDTIYTVKQRFSDWKKNDEPYLTTVCGQVFWFDELEVELVAKQKKQASTKQKNNNDTNTLLEDSKISVGDKVRIEKGTKPILTVQHIIGKVVWFEETNDNCFLDECTKVG